MQGSTRKWIKRAQSENKNRIPAEQKKKYRKESLPYVDNSIVVGLPLPTYRDLSWRSPSLATQPLVLALVLHCSVHCPSAHTQPHLREVLTRRSDRWGRTSSWRSRRSELTDQERMCISLAGGSTAPCDPLRPPSFLLSLRGWVGGRVHCRIRPRKSIISILQSAEIGRAHV